MTTQTVLSQMLVSLLCGVLGFAPVAHTLEIRTKQNLQFQSLANDHVETNLLRAGSVVDIPDRYLIAGVDGRPNHELSLNNWLKNAGQASYKSAKSEGGLFFQSASPAEIEYFYPVKIIQAAPGSRITSFQGRSYFLALRILSRPGKGKNLVTNEDSQPRPVTTQTQPSRKSLQAGAACIDGRCINPEQRPSPSLAQLIGDLSPALNHVQRRTQQNRTRTGDDFKKIRAEFRRSCGFSFDSFLPIIRGRAARFGVPEHIMLSIMVQESSGHCFDIGHNPGSSDHGLFGLNSRSTRIRACSEEEKYWLYNAGVQNLARGPQCIENPIVNLDAAIRKLFEKLGLLSRPFNLFSTRTNGFDERRLKNQQGRYTTEAWRLAVSAYNGGERWVMTAKADLENFDRQQGTQLDPLNWENLRVFYLRRFLSRNREQRYFGRLRDGRTSSALLNLAYTENVVPRHRSKTRETKTIAELWRADRT
jgi:hypothetical protein